MMARKMVTVVCPACFEEFSVVSPPREELPAEWDYDCEVCCRPMIISFDDDGEGGIAAEARSLAE
jgi:Cysteine-rich CPXCG